MNELLPWLREIETSLDSTARDAFARETIPQLADADVAELLAIAGRIERRLEGLQVEAADAVVTRSDRYRDERMTTAYGCSAPIDLLRMLLGTDARSAARLVKASALVHRVQDITSGGYLPARFPALRSAVADGALGVAGLLAATDPLTRSARRILDDDLLRADAELAALSRGVEPTRPSDEPPRPGALPEDLALYAKVMVAYLDPDGPTPPDEDQALRGRYLRVGALKDGVHTVRGALLPEVAAQLALLQDSILSPKTDDPQAAPATGVRFEPTAEVGDDLPEDPAFVDTRTRAQKQHDALAAILAVAAGSDRFPHLGGAAPTLVVSATAEDLARGTGWATLPRTGELVPLAVAHQTACAGGVQRVLFDDHGRIAAIGTSARIFNALQRRAIMIRDGGCIIPGCTTPATWCEIHHVREHADGGPTHTDNGVLLCWWHHRTLHLSEWTIRIDRGVPEIRGPAWWDPHQHWHRPRSPHLRMRSRAPA
ncbi:HNH endonuclease signature motif containing protein [Microbacterium tumbae]